MGKETASLTVWHPSRGVEERSCGTKRCQKATLSSFALWFRWRWVELRVQRIAFLNFRGDSVEHEEVGHDQNQVGAWGIGRR